MSRTETSALKEAAWTMVSGQVFAGQGPLGTLISQRSPYSVSSYTLQ